jgi:hypothetical protein
METKNLPHIPPALPFAAPGKSIARLLLYVMRRMAVGGLRDAHAANAMMGTFGMSHHRPLTFLRVFMAELARAAKRTLMVAPCCCGRMTANETELLWIIGEAARDPGAAHERLAALIGNDDCRAPLSAAIGLSDTLADLGRPVSG